MVTDCQPYQHQLYNVSKCAKNKKTTGQGGFFASLSVRKGLARLRSGRIMLSQIGTRNAFISYYDSSQCIYSWRNDGFDFYSVATRFFSDFTSGYMKRLFSGPFGFRLYPALIHSPPCHRHPTGFYTEQEAGELNTVLPQFPLTEDCGNDNSYRSP